MTREDIEQINDVEPYCFESDREEQWYNIGLKYGLEIADEHPKSPWISVKDDLPCNHKELIDIDTRSIHQKTLFVIVWDGKFIDIDFMFYKKGKWEWVCNNSNTHWFPMPKPLKE